MESKSKSVYFNPRSPWGERPGDGVDVVRGSVISIHAPRGGSDDMDFLSKLKQDISIHAPRGGSDQLVEKWQYHLFYFNPRSPWGERHRSRAWADRMLLISIHAPRGGSDLDLAALERVHGYFNPRSPWGERQQRYTNFKVHLRQRGRIFAFLREERRDSRQAAALRDRFFDGNLGANLPAFSVYYGFAVRESRCPPAYSCSCSRNAPPSFRTGCPSNKTAASPFPCP